MAWMELALREGLGLDVFWTHWWRLAARLVPLLVVAVFVAELARVILGTERLQRLLVGKYRWEGRVRGALLGAVLPFCECGAFPVMVALIRAGIPLGPVLTFFVVSPVLSLPTFSVLAGVLSLRLALAYAVIAVGGGMLAAYFLERTLGEKGALRLVGTVGSIGCGETATASHCCGAGEGDEPESCSCPPAPSRSSGAMLASAWQPTRVTLRRVLPYSLVAIVVAASLRTWLPVEAVTQLFMRSGPWGILLAAVAGMPLYMGCTAAVSLVTPLMQATGAIGPGVAFIIAGAGTSINGLVFMASIFTHRFIALFVASVFLLALICGITLSALPWG